MWNSVDLDLMMILSLRIWGRLILGILEDEVQSLPIWHIYLEGLNFAYLFEFLHFLKAEIYQSI